MRNVTPKSQYHISLHELLLPDMEKIAQLFCGLLVLATKTCAQPPEIEWTNIPCEINGAPKLIPTIGPNKFMQCSSFGKYVVVPCMPGTRFDATQGQCVLDSPNGSSFVPPPIFAAPTNIEDQNAEAYISWQPSSGAGTKLPSNALSNSESLSAAGGQQQNSQHNPSSSHRPQQFNVEYPIPNGLQQQPWVVPANGLPQPNLEQWNQQRPQPASPLQPPYPEPVFGSAGAQLLSAEQFYQAYQASQGFPVPASLPQSVQSNQPLSTNQWQPSSNHIPQNPNPPLYLQLSGQQENFKHATLPPQENQAAGQYPAPWQSRVGSTFGLETQGFQPQPLSSQSVQGQGNTQQFSNQPQQALVWSPSQTQNFVPLNLEPGANQGHLFNQQVPPNIPSAGQGQVTHAAPFIPPVTIDPRPMFPSFVHSKSNGQAQSQMFPTPAPILPQHPAWTDEMSGTFPVLNQQSSNHIVPKNDVRPLATVPPRMQPQPTRPSRAPVNGFPNPSVQSQELGPNIETSTPPNSILVDGIPYIPYWPLAALAKLNQTQQFMQYGGEREQSEQGLQPLPAMPFMPFMPPPGMYDPRFDGSLAGLQPPKPKPVDEEPPIPAYVYIDSNCRAGGSCTLELGTLLFCPDLHNGTKFYVCTPSGWVAQECPAGLHFAGDRCDAPAIAQSFIKTSLAELEAEDRSEILANMQMPETTEQITPAFVATFAPVQRFFTATSPAPRTRAHFVTEIPPMLPPRAIATPVPITDSTLPSVHATGKQRYLELIVVTPSNRLALNPEILRSHAGTKQHSQSDLLEAPPQPWMPQLGSPCNLPGQGTQGKSQIWPDPEGHDTFFMCIATNRDAQQSDAQWVKLQCPSGTMFDPFLRMCDNKLLQHINNTTQIDNSKLSNSKTSV